VVYVTTTDGEGGGSTRITGLQLIDPASGDRRGVAGSGLASETAHDLLLERNEQIRSVTYINTAPSDVHFLRFTTDHGRTLEFGSVPEWGEHPTPAPPCKPRPAGP
jgi:hypothetical protein